MFSVVVVMAPLEISSTKSGLNCSLSKLGIKLSTNGSLVLLSDGPKGEAYIINR